MIKRMIEVFSTTTGELLEEFYLDEFWTVDKLREWVEIDDDDPNIYYGYKLTRAQVIVMGGVHLLEAHGSDGEYFLSYNGTP